MNKNYGIMRGKHGIIFVHPEHTIFPDDVIFDKLFDPKIETYLERIEDAKKIIDGYGLPIAIIPMCKNEYTSSPMSGIFGNKTLPESYFKNPNKALQYLAEETGVNIDELDVYVAGCLLNDCVSSFTTRSFVNPVGGHTISNDKSGIVANPKGRKGTILKDLCRYNSDGKNGESDGQGAVKRASSLYLQLLLQNDN